MKASMLTSLLGVAVFVLLSAVPSQADNCRDRLNNQTFCCQYEASGGGTSQANFVFSGTGNPAFTLNAFDTTLSCVCQANGAVGHGKFDQSKDFICGNTQYGDAAIGTATGTKITKGQYNYGGNQSRIYKCTAGACN